MATATQNKNKVSVLAKDLGMSSKDVVGILKDYTDTVKGASQVLDEREVSILFEYLTQKNQVDIATIFADTYQEKEPKAAAAEKTETPAAKKLAALDAEVYGETAERLSVKAARAAERKRERTRHEKNVRAGGKQGRKPGKAVSSGKSEKK